ncbi:MAG: Rrf2 family transcriptional regulator [Verrucomicrobia bacterium]|nr:Rrf2 family transcriptional regulator [Verrucomicrobiota bacterium]
MRSCRFAFAVHVLAVLALRPGKLLSSAQLADTVNTNPVVIRRLLIDLQNAGLIDTARGPHGGACLAKAPAEVTLWRIHYAVERPTAFALHPNRPSHHCPVGARIERVMGEVQARLLGSMERELKQITLADVLSWLEGLPGPAS